MTTSKLENIIRTLALNKDYQTLIDAQKNPCVNMQYSRIAWLKPPELIEREGVNQGRYHYKLDLSLLIDKSLYQSQSAATMLDRLNEDMLDILSDLSTFTGVVEVRNVRIKPSLDAITHLGDISQHCTAEVICYF